jgi:filamentous hemagglutinin family protein
MRNRLLSASSVTIVLSSLITASSVKAQIAADDTVGTQVKTSDNLHYRINKGSQLGNNLFHSFSQFSLPTNGSALFENALDVENIISRVTGNNISYIDGLLETKGSANLFLINPRGIIFGENSQLNIGGSFVAASADSLKFADGTEFSASNPNSRILTVTVPIGLQYGENPGAIVNRSQFVAQQQNSEPPPDVQPPSNLEPLVDAVQRPVGLQVQPGKTLALLGGELKLEGGKIAASGGRIELGAVGRNSFIKLNQIDRGFAASYQNNGNFQDIQLNNEAILSVNSSVQDTIVLESGEVQIQGKKIKIEEKSGITALNQGEQAGGSIGIGASESLAIIGNRQDNEGDTNLNTSTIGVGKAGDITVKTKRLILLDGGSIFTNALEGKGQSGNLTVNASESVEIIGISPTTDRTSSLNVSTDPLSTGNAGQLKIDTPSLIVRDGGVISAETIGQGNGGALNLSASSIEIVGSSITVSGEDTGAAGNLEIEAQKIDLDRFASIQANTAAGGGNINLIADRIRLRHNSKISTNATSMATGGNIAIDTDTLVAVQDSDITANAERGFGGRVNLNAKGIFQDFNSEITATSELGTQFSGIVQINTPDVDLETNLQELKAEFITAEQVIASSCLTRRNASAGKFVVTGTGGLPYNPYDPLRSEYQLTEIESIEGAGVRGRGEIGERLIEEELVIRPPAIAWKPGDPIQEAQAMSLNDRGQIILGSSSQPKTTNTDETFCLREQVGNK